MPPPSAPAPARARRTDSTTLFVLLFAAAGMTSPWLRGPLEAHPAVAAATTVFASVFVQALPFLVLGVIISALIATFVTPAVIQSAVPRSGALGVLVAGVGGVALPGCECGSVPVARRLMDSGVPSAAALTFLLSAPAINPVVLVATAVAFPGMPGMPVARAVASLLVAVVMGMVWLRFGRSEWLLGRIVDTAVTRAAERGADTPAAGRPRLDVFVEAVRADLLAAGSFLVIGGLAVAAMHVLVPPRWLEGVGGNLAVAIAAMAVLAVVLALCSEADAFIAAAMTTMPLTARLVFLVVGPAVDVKLVAMQAGTFGRSFAVRFAPVTFVVAVAISTVVGLVLLGTGAGPGGAGLP